MVTVFIASFIAVIAIWALFGLWGAKAYKDSLDPEYRAISDAVVANRKDYIIEDGRRLHSDWQKSHPLLGRLYSYKPTKYFRDNQLNTKRYPY